MEPQLIKQKLGAGLLSFPVTHFDVEGILLLKAIRRMSNGFRVSTHPCCSQQEVRVSFSL